jgi:hypothetical protein
MALNGSCRLFLRATCTAGPSFARALRSVGTDFADRTNFAGRLLAAISNSIIIIIISTLYRRVVLDIVRVHAKRIHTSRSVGRRPLARTPFNVSVQASIIVLSSGTTESRG